MKKFMSMMMISMCLSVFMALSVHSIYPEFMQVNATETVVVSTEVETLKAQYQEAEAPIDAELLLCKTEDGSPRACSNEDLGKFLLVSMGGVKGASALALAFIISKFLLLLILSPLFTNMFPSLLKGSVKLVVASGLNLVVGVLALMVPPVELSFGAAITHSSVLALASVFANQAYKQWATAKGQS